MKKLKKYKLDFNPAWEYIKDNLDDINLLSTELLVLLDFRNGQFFTLLPEEAEIERIYQFKWGGLLPPNPIEEYFVNGQRATYSIKTSINEELAELILNEIESNEKLSCFMDDVSASPKDKYYSLNSDNFSFFLGEEVYYILRKHNISYDLIYKCLKFTTSFWHSLCVFTTTELTASTSLNLEMIKEICFNTELVMVGAYDGEGYVFWEKNPKENKPFFSNNTVPIPFCS